MKIEVKDLRIGDEFTADGRTIKVIKITRRDLVNEKEAYIITAVVTLAETKEENMKVTTKKICRGEYNVYLDGKFVGNITAWGNEVYGKEWAAFDENNEWIGTCDTKKECLYSCYS